MSQNIALENIQNNQPDYIRVRELFFEIYPRVVQIGGCNFAALSKYNLLAPMPSDILAIYISGLAYGRASELSEKGTPAWGVFDAWKLVQNDLAPILPGCPKLSAPAEIEIKAPGQRKR